MNQHLDRLDQLAPFLRAPAYQFVATVERKLGVKLLLVYTHRDVRQQMALYRDGREYDREAGVWRVVDATVVKTNAKPGESAHNVVTIEGKPAAVGLDAVPLNLDGTAQWDCPTERWALIYEIAWDCGLDPLGDAIGAHLKNDLGHFEEPAWRLKLDGLGLVLPSAVTQREQGV